MEDVFGTLHLLPAHARTDLLASPVAAAVAQLAEDIMVAEIDPTLSDTAPFCAQHAITPAQAANCIVLEAKRGDRSWFAACVVLGNTRADINGVARRALDAKKVSFAPMETAVSITGMEFGAITPIGLPADWVILVDKAVADAPRVIVGSGIRKSKIAVPGNVFAHIPHAQIIEGLAKTI